MPSEVNRDKVSIVPPVTIISPSVRPVTISLNVVVNGIGDMLVIGAAEDVTTEVGEIESYTTFTVFDLVLKLPAASITLLGRILAGTEPSLLGSTVNV